MIRWKASVPETVFTLPNSKQKIQLCWNDSSEELIINVNYAYIYGLGERYDGVNQNGRVLTILVEEKFCNQGNQSYCPAPFFLQILDFLFVPLQVANYNSILRKITL